MMFRSTGAIAFALIFSGTLLAQGTLSGPSLGFVFDSDAKAIRPVLGIPGSATLGPAIDLRGTSIAKAAVSPQQDFVLGFSTTPSLVLMRFDSVSGSVSIDTNPNVSTVPDLIAISPSGKAAALFYRQTAQLQVLTGLPQSSVVTSTVDVSGLPNSLDTLAITDDGQTVLAGFPENPTPDVQSGEVFAIPADGTAPRSVLTLGHASSISLLNATAANPSQDALVSDDAQNILYRITDVANAATVSQVFGTDAQILGPFAVLPAPDNQKFFVVAKSGTIVVLDVNGADPVRLQCSCTPTGLHRLKGTTSFQLTDSVDGLIWMLDWDPLNPRFLFVPPAPVTQ